MEAPEFDQIGYWSEIKLDIVRDYAQEYSRILAKQEGLYHIYIDGFAGSGVHLSKQTGDFIPGSPLNAMFIRPPFREYHLVDIDSNKASHLRSLIPPGVNASVYEGDCSRVLLDTIFPRARYEDFRRALCLLDPYGLQLSWEVIRTAGKMRSVEIFLNFPLMDMNRNVFWRQPEAVSSQQAARMSTFWGDDSWRKAAYTTEGNLFGWEERQEQEQVVGAFQERLKTVAGFQFVPQPIPMRNSRGAVVYYLFFASQNRVGEKIVQYIFSKYRDRGMK
jgi:three-Cys-motif partner protein